MNIVPREPWTIERFLSWEDRQQGWYEFDGTRIVPMTGGSRAHQRIIFNLLSFLEDRLDPRRFDAVQQMRVDVGGKIRYPDVAICAGRIPGAARTLRVSPVRGAMCFLSGPARMPPCWNAYPMAGRKSP
jgi:Uma2 family endonuclease